MNTYISENLRTEFFKAKKALLEARQIVIISHRSPDGDAVGSNLALRLAMETLGKKVASASVDPVPRDSIFLEKADTFVTEFDAKDFDLIVSVDCGDLKLVKFEDIIPNINFDHHESNNLYGKIANPVEKTASSTSEVIYKFLHFCDLPITIDIANALLHGIYFDTGGMMHSNATSEVFQIAGDLMARGADVQKISKELFHTTAVNKLRLMGRILERIYVNEEGVTVSAVGKHDYLATETTSKDTGGAIDYLNAVPGSKYCVLLSEDEKGVVRGSLRTQREDVNLSEIAARWGGGGHPKASGFGMEGALKPVMSWKVIKESGDEYEEVEF